MRPGSDAWHALPTSLSLEEGRVHVARASARATAASASASELPADECARAAGFRREAPRARFLASRVLLRAMLGRCSEEAAPDAPLTRSPEGKPCLEGEGAPRFSISHAGDLVLVALARADVGVDVEAPRPGLNVVALARRMLGPPAAAALEALDPDARPAAFLVLWTRHEAAVKCRGVGLAGGPNDAEGFLVHSLALPDGYAGAVAAPGRFALSQWVWPP